MQTRGRRHMAVKETCVLHFSQGAPSGWAANDLLPGWTRLSILCCNLGAKRGTSGAIEQHVAGPWHIVALLAGFFEELALDPTKDGHGFLEITATEEKCARSAKNRRLERPRRSKKVSWTSHGPIRGTKQEACWKTRESGRYADASHEPQTRSGTCGTHVSHAVDRTSTRPLQPTGRRRQFCLIIRQSSRFG